MNAAAHTPQSEASGNLQSSINIMPATAVMSLVIEAMRKIVSCFIGAGWPNARVPSASTCTSS